MFKIIILYTISIIEILKSNFKDIFVFITTIATITIAYQTYKLQKQVTNIELEKSRDEKMESLTNIYYFLIDTINKLADISFNFEIFNNCFENSEKYIKDLNKLKSICISEEELNFLQRIFNLMDRYKTAQIKDIEAMKPLKVLYKFVIDTNINPDDVMQLKKNNKTYEVLSLDFLAILLKLRRYMTDDNIVINNDILNIEVNEKRLIIHKKYDEVSYLNYENVNIFGSIERYEPVFNLKNNKIEIEYEKVY